jgi:hypothetical protein
VIGKEYAQRHGTSKFSNEKDLTIDPFDLVVINRQVQ